MIIEEARLDVGAAERWFKDVFADPLAEQVCVERLAASIDVAHRLSPSSWSVTLTPDYVRLNVGQPEALSIHSYGMRLLVRTPVTVPARRTDIQLRRGRRAIFYASTPVPSAECTAGPLPSRRWPSAVAKAHEAYLRASVESKGTTPHRKSFSPSVLLYMEKLLGRPLPRPDWWQERAQAKHAPLVRVFDVNADADAHQHFQSWRRRHPEGFFLNLRSSREGLLHRVSCPHPGSTVWSPNDGGGDLSRRKKICATSAVHLQVWAIRESITVRACRDCKPPMSDDLQVTAVQLERSGAFDPESERSGREYALKSIALRRGQPAFRERLMRAYDGRCAISGSSVPGVLEAAHIVPYDGAETNHPANGILLRADFHTLFDLGLIAIEPSRMKVVIADELRKSEYRRFEGVAIVVPPDIRCEPDRKALALRYEEFRKRASKMR